MKINKRGKIMEEFENYQSYFEWKFEDSKIDAMGKTEIYTSTYDIDKQPQFPMKALIRYFNDTSTINSDAMISVFLKCDENDITDTMSKIVLHDLASIIYKNKGVEYTHKNGAFPPEIHCVIHYVDQMPEKIDTWFTIYCS